MLAQVIVTINGLIDQSDCSLHVINDWFWTIKRLLVSWSAESSPTIKELPLYKRNSNVRNDILVFSRGRSFLLVTSIPIRLGFSTRTESFKSNEEHLGRADPNNSSFSHTRRLALLLTALLFALFSPSARDSCVQPASADPKSEVLISNQSRKKKSPKMLRGELWVAEQEMCVLVTEAETRLTYSSVQ